VGDHRERGEHGEDEGSLGNLARKNSMDIMTWYNNLETRLVMSVGGEVCSNSQALLKMAHVSLEQLCQCL
jgi:hypothetical protein